MNTILQDLRYALRRLSQSPGFTLGAVLTLALGIGANAAVFSIVDGVLFRSLPFRDPDRLVQIHGVDPRNGDTFRALSLAHYRSIREARAFEATVAMRPSWETLAVPSERAVEIQVARASDDLPGLLGLAPILGRNPSAEAWSSGAHVLVLTQSIWRSLFRSDPGVIGRSVLLDGESFVIAAVLPGDVTYPPEAGAWRPMRLEERTDDDPDHAVLARLAPGVDLRRAEEEVRALTRSYVAAGANEPARLDARLANARDSLVRSARGPLLLIQGAALAILLVMCLNLAHLLLARGEARASELAVRAALGAARSRLLAGVITEAAVLAVLGCAAGLLVASFVLPVLRTFVPPGVPSFYQIELDRRVLGVMVAASVVTFLAFSAWPALRASNTEPRAVLAGGGGSAGKDGGRTSRLLVSVQVALSTVLVTAALLLTTSFVRLSQVDRGFDEGSRLWLPLAASFSAAEATGGSDAYLPALLHVVTATPGVRSAALATHPPTATRTLNFRLFGLTGLTASPEERPTTGGVAVVSPGYFATAGLALIEGRGFAPTDREDAEPVAVVSESFARTYLQDRPALGAVFGRASFDDGEAVTVRVVGVVEDTRPVPGEPTPELLYLPLSQVGFGPGLLVRAVSDLDAAAVAAGIQERLRRFDPTLPTNRLMTLQPPERVVSTGFQAWTVGLFAGLALVLAAVGIYGISAYAVERRRREIGIRCALGASRGSVQLEVLGGAATVTGLGGLLGLVGSALMSGLLRRLVFGVDPLAPAVVATVLAVLAGVSLLAAWLPARRAARVDPIIALKEE